MKKSRIVEVTSNLIIVLVVLSMILLTNSIYVITPASGEGLTAIYRGNPNNKNVSFMVNVYWGTEYVEPILEMLANNEAKATFFVGGTWANSNSDVLQKIVEAGHEVGNHGYYHKDHTRISKERNREEIYITHELVKALVNKEMTLFAPPSGAFNDVTLEVAEALNYKTIMWSKDTIDWRDKDASLVYKRATKNPQNGDLILMHPTAHTLEALQDIIPFYKNNQFSLVTVSENIAN
jgi:probable sporulation protein (polysaccharide deacetylase family)